MAQSLQSIEVLIKNSFALQVAVRSTEDADAICRKNRLTFSELLRPFSHLGNEGEFSGMGVEQLLLCATVGLFQLKSPTHVLLAIRRQLGLQSVNHCHCHTLTQDYCACLI